MTFMSLLRFALACFSLPALVVLTGCGNSDEGELVIVRGKLTENGKPFVLDQAKIPIPKGATAPPPGSEGLRIVFIAMGGKKTSKNIDTDERFPATYHADTGTFEVPGPKGKGIRPGRYKITIIADYSISGGKDKESSDYFGGKFSQEKTQIIREVNGGEEIAIELAKPQG
jgi:hypothetical protein